MRTAWTAAWMRELPRRREPVHRERHRFRHRQDQEDRDRPRQLHQPRRTEQEDHVQAQQPGREPPAQARLSQAHRHAGQLSRPQHADHHHEDVHDQSASAQALALDPAQPSRLRAVLDERVWPEDPASGASRARTGDLQRGEVRLCCRRRTRCRRIRCRNTRRGCRRQGKGWPRRRLPRHGPRAGGPPGAGTASTRDRGGTRAPRAGPGCDDGPPAWAGRGCGAGARRAASTSTRAY